MSEPEALTPELLLAHPLPRLAFDSDKDVRGRVLVVGGGGEVPGAVLLAGVAALRTGAGKLQLAAGAAWATALAMAVPEARVVTVPSTEAGDLKPEAAAILAELIGRCDAVVVGPGMLDESMACELTARLLRGAGETAFVLDAAAMTALRPAVARRAGGRLVLTPHAGEMAALSGRSKDEVLADPLGAAREMAASLQAVIVMKGADTRIVTPSGLAWIHCDGPLGLATGGSGDVLAGVIGGLLARGLAPAAAALWGVFLHGQAGARLSREVGPLGFLARELPGQIPRVLAEFGGGV
jgi:hydroxyethylthiazole kinase-like uncharacterized protein yjeF